MSDVESSEVAIRRLAMPRCQERHPDLWPDGLTGFFTPTGFVAACARCQAEIRGEMK